MEKDKPTELEETRRNRLSQELIINHKNLQILNLRKEEIREELSKVAPLKIGDLVKTQGYRDNYVVKTVRPYIKTDSTIGFMYHLLQEGSDVNYKYNVDSINITKIK